MNSLPAGPNLRRRSRTASAHPALRAGGLACVLVAIALLAAPTRAAGQEADGIVDLFFDWLYEPTRAAEEAPEADAPAVPAHQAAKQLPPPAPVVVAAEEAIEEKRLDDAIASLHQYLVNHPADVPANLAIADAFYQKAEISFLGLEDILARRHYERALATNLPPETEKEARTAVRNIRHRQRLWLRAGAGLVPAPENASGGLGVLFRAGGTYRHPIGETTRLQFDLTADVRDFADGHEDEQRLSFRVGPRIQVAPDTRVTLLATNRQFWTGGNRESFDIGAHVDVYHRLSNIVDLAGGYSWTSRTRVDMSRQAAQGREGRYVEKGGHLQNLWFRPSRRLSSTLRVHGLIRADTERTSRIWDRLHRVRVGAGARIQLPRGFTVGGYFEVRKLRFTETPRRTTEYFVRGSLLNRQIRIIGFSPELVFNVTEKRSNLPLADTREYGGLVRFSRQL